MRGLDDCSAGARPKRMPVVTERNPVKSNADEMEANSTDPGKITRKEQLHETKKSAGENHADDPARTGERYTSGDQLTDQATAGGSERGADREFSSPPSCACE